MFGVDDFLIGAGISGMSSIFTNLTNSNNVEATNQANAAQAQANREFQERMSNTAYQRGMSDMKLAGLNPILAYQKGGASSPSGSQAAMQPFEIKGNPGAEAVNSGMALVRARLENANLFQTNKNLQSTEARQDAETANIQADTAIRKANLSAAEREQLKAEEDKKVYQTPLGSTARRAGTYSEEISRTTDPILNSGKKVADIFASGASSIAHLSPREVTRSGSRWSNPMTGENHYQDTTFSRRWPHN